MPMQTIHKFTCDQCGESATIEPILDIMSGFDSITITTKSNPPEGWKIFRHLLLCPKHDLKRVTLIDGKEVPDD